MSFFFHLTYMNAFNLKCTSGKLCCKKTFMSKLVNRAKSGHLSNDQCKAVFVCHHFVWIISTEWYVSNLKRSSAQGWEGRWMSRRFEGVPTRCHRQQAWRKRRRTWRGASLSDSECIWTSPPCQAASSYTWADLASASPRSVTTTALWPQCHHKNLGRNIITITSAGTDVTHPPEHVERHHAPAPTHKLLRSLRRCPQSCGMPRRDPRCS